MDIGILEPGKEAGDGVRDRVLADLVVEDDEPAPFLREVDVVLDDRVLQVADLPARPAGPIDQIEGRHHALVAVLVVVEPRIALENLREILFRVLSEDAHALGARLSIEGQDLVIGYGRDERPALRVAFCRGLVDTVDLRPVLEHALRRARDRSGTSSRRRVRPDRSPRFPPRRRAALPRGRSRSALRGRLGLLDEGRSAEG